MIYYILVSLWEETFKLSCWYKSNKALFISCLLFSLIETFIYFIRLEDIILLRFIMPLILHLWLFILVRRYWKLKWFLMQVILHTAYNLNTAWLWVIACAILLYNYFDYD